MILAEQLQGHHRFFAMTVVQRPGPPSNTDPTDFTFDPTKMRRQLASYRIFINTYTPLHTNRRSITVLGYILFGYAEEFRFRVFTGRPRSLIGYAVSAFDGRQKGLRSVAKAYALPAEHRRGVDADDGADGYSK
ncbi:MAG: hypothetical protein EOQ62_04055 [Mesorhizobium sp.]|uniref:hypothetical protein n=1 Tax=Mesorhizobium sp. TaxID=1871066 RepID=UPI000FE956D8|nr:hypothetical protein [Mesorhizobium sp.]RWG50464.1 MAG: hypothetical protein EOQ62_04055 [Mesorhizobium sp.]RWL05220.1 MAG: hypothetical protein EOR55_13220 [Mesorhizobium sp.]TIN10243.1 MAG: hypothetical protein E5Y14_11970 [Mesorhizobium sp.]TIQ62160.1 MAG: hypothetical protein E5X41_29485 [Mesorhizobium sp.]